jgi:hypothetical protein
MAHGLKAGEGRWRVYSADGAVLHGPKKHLRDCRAWLGRRAGGSVTLTPHGDGSHSAVVNGETYFALQETGMGFPPGSGLEGKRLIQAHTCGYEHPPGTECP